MEFLPPNLSILSAFVLILVAFIGSVISAGVGIGGGITFLTVLASIVPAPAIIPIHGVVQLGSNVSRATVQRKHINWHITVYFVLGSIAGVIIGGSLALQLPENMLKLLLALYILYSIWGPIKLGLSNLSPAVLSIAGLFSAFITMFLGATGPFVISILAPCIPDRKSLFGTHEVCMVIQHSLKILVFGLLGFSFGPWLPLLAIMIAAGYFGTLLGSRLTELASESLFRKILKIILTILAINLLLSGSGVYS